MLVAIDELDNRVLGDVAERSGSYYCPECRAPVVLRRGSVRVPHFAHVPDAQCEYGKSESLRHMLMKWHVGQLFDRNRVDYEVKLISSRRADVCVSLGGTPFVVECQHSRISRREWTFRSLDYSGAGYSILWVWSIERLKKDLRMIKDLYNTPLYYGSIPKEIRYAESKIGEIYLIDNDGHLARVCFKPDCSGFVKAVPIIIPRVREVRYKTIRPNGWKRYLRTVSLWR